MSQQFLTKYCKNCALRNPNAPKCQLTGLEIEPLDPACKHYTEHLDECGICHKKLPKGEVVDVTNPADVFYICPNCESLIGMCQTCEKVRQCLFESDPSSLPKIIPQTVRQGNAIMQTQVRNPERVKITCEEKCACYDKEYGCTREQSQCCDKYIFSRG